MAKEKDETPEVMAPPNPWDVLDRLGKALETAKAAPAETPGVGDIMARLTEALERVSASQIEGAKIITAEQRRSFRPSNEIPPRLSTLNPRGERDYPKPALKCIMMIPWLADVDSLTREEVELLNLLQPGDYVITKSDGTKVKLACKIDYAMDEITPSRLLLTHETAFNNDNHRWMVPLTTLLRQIHHQSKVDGIKAQAAAVLTMDEEVALIEAGKLQVSE